LPEIAHAQSYPARAVRIVVGYPPGGPTDLIARLIAQRLSESTKQQFIVDNRGGANGIIGTEIVVRSQPDGHTLLFGTSSLASNGSLYPKLPYDAAKDLSPITLSASTPYFLVVNAALPAASVKELIALARAKPGQINFGSAGNGAGTHLAGEMFNVMANVKLVHVPYKGTGPSVTDLVAGRIEMMFVGLPSVVQHVKAGRLRLLAVAEPRRSPLMPELPTVGEAGLPGYQSSAWFGFFGPAGMTRDLRRRVADEVTKVTETRELQERMLALGAVPLTNTPEQFDVYFREEVARYAKVIREAAVTLD
jgi:tripartite-type tricarboxylate transporter receptor subunit TctC